MNVRVLAEDAHGELSHYAALAVVLTAVSIWILVALHNKHRHEDPNVSFASRLQWPVKNLMKWGLGKRRAKEPKDFV